MPIPDTAKAIADLVASARAIERSLGVIAHALCLPHIYPDQIANDLFQRYEELIVRDAEALAQIEEIRIPLTSDGLTYEQRVRKFGKAEVDRRWAPYLEALTIRKSTAGALGMFRSLHPLIVTIVDASRSS